jgi:hypothetical protein
LLDFRVKLSEGDNHLISARNGIATCQVWVRPDLSPEDGARNARQMSEYLTNQVLFAGSPYRGVLFDLRKGPPVFGPKTRETLAGFFTSAATAKIPIAVLVGESPIQVLQFRNLCRDAGGRADVFDNEPDALRWFGLSDATERLFANSSSSRPPGTSAKPTR